MNERCCVCTTRPATKRHRCDTCYAYLRRHGYDRSWEQVEAQQRRDDAKAVAHMLGCSP